MVHDSMPSRGVWGHGPPENFGILDTQRVLLVHFLISKSTSVYAYSSQSAVQGGARPKQGGGVGGGHFPK